MRMLNIDDIIYQNTQNFIEGVVDFEKSKGIENYFFINVSHFDSNTFCDASWSKSSFYGFNTGTLVLQ